MLEQKVKYELGQTVYHKDVYNYAEPLKVVGIKEKELQLQGDYSGGMYNVCQTSWLPIGGVSKTRNYGLKLKLRQDAIAVDELSKNCVSDDPTFIAMRDMMNAVLILTNDI